MKTTRAHMAGFRSWLFNVNQLNKGTVYNYVSRVRAILTIAPEPNVENVAAAIDQLTTKQMSGSSFRTPWKHYAEYMSAEKGVDLPVPRPISASREIVHPVAVVEAAMELMSNHFYTPELIANSKWGDFDKRPVQGCWKMTSPEKRGEFWRPSIDCVMTLFQWSASVQPEDDTPLWAYRPDSKVPLSARAIAKLCRERRNNR